jgi:hypothetical protein
MASRNWKLFDYRYGVVVSPSQMETWDSCRRKWWLQKVVRLPEPPFAGNPTGDAFHDLCERYLRGDDSPQFGESWDDEWRDRVDKVDRDLLARAFSRMVDDGVLVRRPGTEPEKAIQLEVLPGRQASLIGFADVLGPGRVEDHKTTKSPRWLSTDEDLGRDLAMLCYAKAALAEGVDEVVLRHNQAVLDPLVPEARSAETTVRRGLIEAHWKANVSARAKAMLELKLSRTPPSSWAQVPGPENPKKACHAYGKRCPYYSVCHEGLSPADYRARQEAAG